MSRIHFDHIAIATHRMADAPAVLVGVLGGTPTGDGGPSGAYTWGHWRFAGGGRLEILEPLGADGFLHRFLATRGPGIHHVTFRVPSLAEAYERAGAHGLRIVGRDESDPAWAEAFLHPKEALGLVVQLVESRVAEMRPPFVAPPGPAQPPPAVTVLGLRTRARTAERAHTLWGAVLQGHRAEVAGALVYRWPGSPMRIAVELDPGADEGAVAVELAADRAGGLAETLHPVLGTVFRRSDA